MGASDKLGASREGLGEMTNWMGAQPLRQRNHRMTRRELMLLLGSAMTVPRALRAQQKAMPVIGYLGSASPGPFAPFLAAFHQGLSETGYVEGQNVSIEYRWAEGRYDRLTGSSNSFPSTGVRTHPETGRETADPTSFTGDRGIGKRVFTPSPSGRLISLSQAPHPNGKHGHVVDYRHVIHSFRRKPTALRDLVYRVSLCADYSQEYSHPCAYERSVLHGPRRAD
jgi:hypothetical protein